jgi:hypothetical protein
MNRRRQEPQHGDIARFQRAASRGDLILPMWLANPVFGFGLFYLALGRLKWAAFAGGAALSMAPVLLGDSRSGLSDPHGYLIGN